MNRYFLIMYEGWTYREIKVIGVKKCITTGKYLNSHNVCEHIANKYKLIDVITTNIIELSKDDFDTWCEDV